MKNYHFFKLTLICISINLLYADFVFSQSNYCGFDGYLSEQNQNPEFLDDIQEQEDYNMDMMDGDHQAIMNNEIYTIPVVFHIIHLNEAIGNGSNISDSDVNQALVDLNNAFRNTSNNGFDTEIQFCLAQRDPSNLPTNGINRINGAGVSNYASVGISGGGNEAEIKALSQWDRDSYLNIWTVHDIQSAPGTSILGFATFPTSTNVSTDGVVLRSDVTGSGNFPNVINHEVGHWLTLFHTFEGGTTTTCPINNNCLLDGDRVCDTRPHKTQSTSPFACDENLSMYTDCDASSNYSWLATENFMNYTDDNCAEEFSPGQTLRMRLALMNSRSGLLLSLGCALPCDDTQSLFTFPNDEVDINTTVNFTNQSVNAVEYIWRINYEETFDAENLEYNFSSGGVYEICLDAVGPNGCIDRYCDEIRVFNNCVFPTNECSPVINGGFEFISQGDDVNAIENVCGWVAGQATPFYCDLNSNNAIGLLSGDFQSEMIITNSPLDLEPYSFNEFSIDYLATVSDPIEIIVALVDDNSYSSENTGTFPPDATIIARIENVDSKYSDQDNDECYDESFSFESFDVNFFNSEPNNTYLAIMLVSDVTSLVYIDNVKIGTCDVSGCATIPDFDFEIDTCNVSFVGQTQGFQGEFTWNFDDGSIGFGTEIEHEFIYGNDFNVCLTVTCDQEEAVTICKEISIPNSCNQCETNRIRSLATRCGNDPDSPVSHDFSFDAPKGFEPCQPGSFFIQSQTAAFNVTSYDVDTTDPDVDTYRVLATSSPIGDADSDDAIVGHITLCGPNGEMICYRFFGSVRIQCDNCLEPIISTATCNDPDAFDDEYIYTGTIEIELDDNNGGYSICDVSPASNGFSGFPTPTQGNTSNIFVLDYNITINEPGPVNTNVLLCFTDRDDGTRVCIEIIILAPVPCFDPPEECAQEWVEKPVECIGSENGFYIVNFDMNVGNIGLQECDGGLFGTIDGGGFVDIISSSIGDEVIFSSTIYIPCDNNEIQQSYELRIYMCNGSGQFVCYSFPFNLECNRECEGPDSSLGTNGRSSENDGLSDLGKKYIDVFPNPTSSFLNINIKTNIFESLDVSLYDQVGKLISKKELKSKNNIIDLLGLERGIYFLKIENDNKVLSLEKVIIL